MRAARSILSSVLLSLVLTPALARDDAASRASEASIEHLSAVPAAALAVLVAGGEFSVAAVRPAGDAVEVVLHATAGSAEFTVTVAGASAAMLGTMVGNVVGVTVVGGGYLLSVGAVTLAFVPSAAVEALAHHRELLP